MEYNLIQPIIFAVILFFIIELVVYTRVYFVNKKFQWLIIAKDENPSLSQEGLKKFIPDGYDPELGWIRKPNTEHIEKGQYGITKWTINPKGARNNPGFENSNSKNK